MRTEAPAKLGEVNFVDGRWKLSRQGRAGTSSSRRSTAPSGSSLEAGGAPHGPAVVHDGHGGDGRIVVGSTVQGAPPRVGGAEGPARPRRPRRPASRWRRPWLRSVDNPAQSGTSARMAAGSVEVASPTTLTPRWCASAVRGAGGVLVLTAAEHEGWRRRRGGRRPRPPSGAGADGRAGAPAGSGRWRRTRRPRRRCGRPLLEPRGRLGLGDEEADLVGVVSSVSSASTRRSRRGRRGGCSSPLRMPSASSSATFPNSVQDMVLIGSHPQLVSRPAQASRIRSPPCPAGRVRGLAELSGGRPVGVTAARASRCSTGRAPHRGEDRRPRTIGDALGGVRQLLQPPVGGEVLDERSPSAGRPHRSTATFRAVRAASSAPTHSGS